MEPNNIEVKKDVYALVTDRIIELLEAGTIPWRKPWTERGMPQNLISKRYYRGINLMLLNSLEFSSNLFLTWKQLKTISASVKKGEKGTLVVFSKMVEQEVQKNGTTSIEKRSMLRYYKVFNIEQCTDIPAAFLPTDGNHNEPMQEYDRIVSEMKEPPIIEYNEDEAFYDPDKDIINMPRLESFESSEAYYGTLYHELIHSTGHSKRLNRKGIVENYSFGTEMYSEEELIAEIGACYLKSYTGILIDDLNNSASYIAEWLKVLKNNRRFIVIASGRSQQAVEYILSKSVPSEEAVTSSDVLV